MNIGAISIASIVTTILMGCAQPKDFAAVDGSRADGTVQLSYDFGSFQLPQVNEEQGLDVAKKRCVAWGYTGAERFAGSKRTCSEYFGGDTRIHWVVTVNYQCTKEPAKVTN